MAKERAHEQIVFVLIATDRIQSGYSLDCKILAIVPIGWIVAQNCRRPEFGQYPGRFSICINRLVRARKAWRGWSETQCLHSSQLSGLSQIANSWNSLGIAALGRPFSEKEARQILI